MQLSHAVCHSCGKDSTHLCCLPHFFAFSAFQLATQLTIYLKAFFAQAFSNREFARIYFFQSRSQCIQSADSFFRCFHSCLVILIPLVLFRSAVFPAKESILVVAGPNLTRQLTQLHLRGLMLILFIVALIPWVVIAYLDATHLIIIFGDFYYSYAVSHTLFQLFDNLIKRLVNLGLQRFSDFLYAFLRIIREAAQYCLCYLTGFRSMEVIVKVGIQSIFTLAVLICQYAVHLAAHPAGIFSVACQAFADIAECDVVFQMSTDFSRQQLRYIICCTDFQVCLSIDDVFKILFAYACCLCCRFQKLIAALLIKNVLCIYVNSFQLRAFKLIIQYLVIYFRRFFKQSVIFDILSKTSQHRYTVSITQVSLLLFTFQLQRRGCTTHKGYRACSMRASAKADRRRQCLPACLQPTNDNVLCRICRDITARIVCCSNIRNNSVAHLLHAFFRTLRDGHCSDVLGTVTQICGKQALQFRAVFGTADNFFDALRTCTAFDDVQDFICVAEFYTCFQRCRYSSIAARLVICQQLPALLILIAFIIKVVVAGNFVIHILRHTDTAADAITDLGTCCRACSSTGTQRCTAAGNTAEKRAEASAVYAHLLAIKSITQHHLATLHRASDNSTHRVLKKPRQLLGIFLCFFNFS